jgi:hypothetical protein
VNIAAVGLTATGAETGTRDYRRLVVNNTNPVVTTPTPPTTTTTTTTTTTAPPPPTTTTSTPMTYSETTGSDTNTWTNYTDAGGTQGPTIPPYRSVQVTCKITGFQVADGNTWWYEIATGPWNNEFYASADAFYNNGQMSGSLIGTPFVDPNVPNC